MPSATMLLVLLFVFVIFGGPRYVTRVIEGRRKHQLALKREEARIAEAKAKEMEIAQKRAELEYREALLELERFDRRPDQPAAGPSDGPPSDRRREPPIQDAVPPAAEPPDPPDPPEPGREGTA